MGYAAQAPAEAEVLELQLSIQRHLSGELAAEHERAERLERMLRTEAGKREASQAKGRRLLAERLKLQAEVATLRLKRRRTACMLWGLRWVLKDERRANGALSGELNWESTVAATMTDTVREYTHRLVGAEVELERLRPAHASALLQLANNAAVAGELRRAAGCIAKLTELVEELKRERERLRTALRRESEERDALLMGMSEPARRAHEFEQQVDALQLRLQQLGAENEATGEALEQAKREAEEARAEAEALRGELARVREEHSDSGVIQ